MYHFKAIFKKTGCIQKACSPTMKTMQQQQKAFVLQKKMCTSEIRSKVPGKSLEQYSWKGPRGIT